VIETRYVTPVIPESARKRCNDPSVLPDRAMPAGEVTSAWNADRSALRTCEQRRSAAVAAVDGAAP
jgi:hypothetical protein